MTMDAVQMMNQLIQREQKNIHNIDMEASDLMINGPDKSDNKKGHH